MTKLIGKKEVRFSIIVIICGIILLISTFFFPWISYQEFDNGTKEFHLNFEMMRDSSYPEIKSVANKLDVINIFLWFTVIIGLLSLLSASYNSAIKYSRIGYYLLTTINIFIIIISFIIGYLYFSVIQYINDIETISLSSPFQLFSYPFISLIASFIFLIISGLYGGSITFRIIKQFKELKIKEKKEGIFPVYAAPGSDNKHLKIDKWRKDQVKGIYNITEKKDGLPTLSKEGSERKEEDIQKKSEEKTTEPFSFDRPKEKIPEDVKAEDVIEKRDDRVSEPFSFDEPKEKIPENVEEKNIGLVGKSVFNNNIKKHEIKKAENLGTITDFEKDKISKSQPEIGTSEKNQIHINFDKKTITVRCPECKKIFPAEKSGEITSIKCPYCGKEGIIN